MRPRGSGSFPHFEKLLDVNATLARLFLEAGREAESQRVLPNARATRFRYVQNWLADPVDGGWYGSQEADDAGPTPLAPAMTRRRALAPLRGSISHSLYADSNAVMVSTAAQVAKRICSPTMDCATSPSSRSSACCSACYKPGSGVAHYYDGEPQGERPARGSVCDGRGLS